MRGDTIELWPAYEEFAYRIELWGDEVEAISVINPTSGETIKKVEEAYIYPAKHFVMPADKMGRALAEIEGELNAQLERFHKEGKLLEAQRLSARTRYDTELMKEAGFCPGIENYSRALAGRKPGQPPDTLLDFFPKDFLTIIDESHVSVPQVRAMYNGDQARKKTLVEHGFRLPMAMDNRPLQFEEWEQRRGQTIFVSATPNDWELDLTGGEIVEQVIRPTGLVDPQIHVVPARGQVPHLLEQIGKRVERNERVLVTCLTKRLSEDLTAYLQEAGIKCMWLHSEMDAIERVQVLRELREGSHDVVIGVNLLREGLDLPEVSLVAILDADKEGFLRSETSLIQTIGRSARNVNAEVFLYADRVTDSMARAMEETNRRRAIQIAHNKKHGITPRSTTRKISGGIEAEVDSNRSVREAVTADEGAVVITKELIAELEKEMLSAAENLEFEKAAGLRDKVAKLSDRIGEPLEASDLKPAAGRGKRGRRGRGGGKKGERVPKPAGSTGQ